MKLPSKPKANPIDPKEYVFTFGKYKGSHFLDVYEQDPDYIDWCARENAGGLNLPTKAKMVDRWIDNPRGGSKMRGRGQVIGIDSVWLERQLQAAPVGLSNPDAVDMLDQDGWDEPKSKFSPDIMQNKPLGTNKEEAPFCHWPYPPTFKADGGVANFSWVGF